jgi:hypothetical protein
MTDHPTVREGTFCCFSPSDLALYERISSRFTMRRARFAADASISPESPHERPRSRQNLPATHHVHSYFQCDARASGPAAGRSSCGNVRLSHRWIRLDGGASMNVPWLITPEQPEAFVRALSA